MTYRDDHDAAIARAEALEAELARAREEAAEKAADLEASEREQARLRRELETARAAAKAQPPGPAPAKPVDADHRRSREPEHDEKRVLQFGVGVVLIAILGLAAYCNQRTEDRERREASERHDEQMRRQLEESSDPTCQLESNPPGATLTIVVEDFVADPMSDPVRKPLGTAPLVMKYSELAGTSSLGRTIEASMPGYHVATQSISFMPTCPSTFHLQPM